MRALIVSVVISGGVATASADTAVYTTTSNAHACAVHESGILAGTDGGLVDLDTRGAARKVWTSLDGLGGTRVRALHLRGDRLIAGTEAGLSIGSLAGGQVSIDRVVKTEPIRAIAEINKAIYAATWGGGLVRLDVDRGRAVPVRFAGPKSPGRARITAVVEHRGAVHVATAGAGIWKLSGGALVPVAGAGQLVWALASRRGKLYAGTVAGLALVSGVALQPLGGADVRALAVDGDQLWLGTFGDGGYRYRGRLLRAGLPAKARFVQAIDRSAAGACLATRDGVWFRRTASPRWLAAALTPAPSSNDISAIARDGDRLWVGTFDQGVSIFEAGRWRRFEHQLIDAKVNAIAVSDGAVWIATAAGLGVVRGDRVQRMGPRDGLPSRHVLSLAALADGRMLVGTSQGAALIDGSGESNAVTPLGRKQGVLVGNVWAVAGDADGYLWLGSTRGLFRGKPGETWSRYSLSSKHLRDDWVMALVIDPTPGARRVWAGTYKGGVTRFDWSATESAEVTARQLGDGWINPGGLTFAGGRLYAATMDGLLAGDGTGAEWQRLAGGPGRDTTATVATASGLWIATRRGLVRRPQ
jgi:ligand-binding sensor domain-containing protein